MTTSVPQTAPKPFRPTQFDEKEFINSLKDEDFWDNPDLSEEVEKQVRYNIQSKEPVFEDYKKYILIVENIPTIHKSRLDDLKQRINQILDKAGVTVLNIEYPFDADNSKGFFLVFLESENDCLKLKKYLTNYKFSPSYTLKCFTLADRNALLLRGANNETVSSHEFEELPGVDDHLLNYKDTLAVADGRGTCHIYSVDPQSLVCSLQQYTASKIQWSPKGTYLVGFDEAGLILSSAISGKTLKFAHGGAMSCEFSPCERFMISYAYNDAENNQTMLVNVWDVNYNKTVIKRFSCSNQKLACFRWSYDGTNLSFLSDESLFIYDLNTNQLLGGRPLKIPGIQSYEWSPVSSQLVYWERIEAETKSNIVLLNIPSFEKLILFQAFNLEKCTLVWNHLGTSLTVSHVRNIKKINYHSLEIIRPGQSGTPVESKQYKNPIEDVAWEPFGTFFAVASPPETTILKQVDQSTHMVIKVIDGCSYHRVLWSPYGRIVILASTKSHVYFEVHICEGKSVTLLGRGKHIDADHIAWSASGRYFMTCAGVGEFSSSSKILIWSCCGYTIENILIINMAYCLWRPRPKNFIKSEEVESIWTHIDNYAKGLAAEDRKLMKNKNVGETSFNLKKLFPTLNDERFSTLRQISQFYCQKAPALHSQPLETVSHWVFNFKSKA